MPKRESLYHKFPDYRVDLEPSDEHVRVTLAGETLVDTTRAGVSYHYSGAGGFWVPEVAAGDTVGVGHLLGTICEVIGGGRLEAIRADRSGVVVTMRTYPVVYARELLVRVGEGR